MYDIHQGTLNAASAPTEERTEEAPLPLKYADPITLRVYVAGAKADHEVVLYILKSKGDVPAKVLLSWLADRLNAAIPEFLYQPPRHVVTEATRIYEVFLRLRCIEGTAPECY